MRPSRTRRVLAAGWPYLLLLAAVLVFYRAVLFLPDYGVPWDLPGFHLPHLAYLSESLHRGEIPWWEPYAYCGRPFAANMQTEVFYPFRALTALAGAPRDTGGLYDLFEIEEVLHVFLAASLAYWLAGTLGLGRPASLTVGIVYSLGCFFASQAEHIGEVETAAWLPLAWGALVNLRREYRRRDFLLLAAALAMAILAGCAPLTVIVFLAAFLLAAALVATRAARPALLLNALGGAALAACLCAFILIPAAQFTLSSVARYRTDWRGTGGGVPLAALFSLFDPNHYGIFNLATYKAPYEITLLYLYCGIPALVLAAAAIVLRRTRLKAAVSIALAISGIWMLGDSTPAGAWLYRMLPGIVRGGFYPQFWMPVFGLSMALLAGFGVAQHIRSARLGYAVAALCAADLILVGSGRPMNTTRLSQNPIVTADSFEGRSDALAVLRMLTAGSPRDRIDTVDDSLSWALTPAITRLPIANGYDPQALIRFIQARLAVADGRRWGAYYQAEHPSSPMLAAMNVKYLLSRKPLDSAGRLRLAREVAGRYIYENPAALPRFYFARRVVCAAGMEEAASLVRRPDWDPAAETVVECPPARAGSYASGQVADIRYGGNAVTFNATAGGPAFLATAETQYPGWKAYVDGVETPIYYSNVAFRGVFVAAGRHRIEMRYSPALFGYSALVSLAAAILLVVLLRYRKL